MASFLQQFGTENHTSSSATTTVTIPAGGITSGHSLVLSIEFLVSAIPGVTSMTGSDSRGNTYTSGIVRQHSGTTNPGISVGVLYGNITTSLQAGDTVTITPNHATNRVAVSVFEFDVTLTADQSAANDEGDNSSTALNSTASGMTTTANELVIGAFALVNPGRIFTLGSGFSEGTKIQTTGGTSDRAVVAEYKFVTSTGPQTATGTLNSSGFWVAAVQTFSYSGGGGGGGPRPGTGRPKVWNGSAWVAHDAYVWNGSAWVTHKAKGWDGSDWIESK
jgi:hypothetical protein